MQALPTGNVTFLFTDIAGSTRLWERYPREMPAILARHDALMREAIEDRQGHVFKTVGDAFCAAFTQPLDGVLAAADCQRAIMTRLNAPEVEFQVRMALHTGVAVERDNDYFGQPLNRVARLLSTAHGGQVILSSATRGAIPGVLPPPFDLLDLGQHRLQDLLEPETVHQLLHPDLPGEFPPLRSLQRYQHNLPCQLTSFIGREEQVSEVKHLLETSRLVTLTGSGGVGKTRLALQAAADSLASYPEGVWLVELAALTNPELIPQTVAAGLDVREEPGRPVLDTLTTALRAKNALLVLDNCEHLVEASARFAETVLRACPAIRILATSRESLQIAGEYAYRVPSLATPAAKQRARFADVANVAAVRLFEERAAVGSPSFRISPENVDSVVTICNRLDGIPFAIELAAARVRSLTVGEIARRLDDQFALLTRGSRTALPRQQTLRAMVDWSWDLLSTEERTVLRRLSVFAGGWELDAAEQVCPDPDGRSSGPGPAIDRCDVLDLLDQLVDKSLVVAEDRAGRPRYRQLETIRAYGAERLRGAAEEEVVRRRHFEWALALAEEAAPHLDGPGIQEGLNRLELEHDNIRTALTFAPAAELRLQLAIAVHRFWFIRGHFREGREWLDSSLRDAPHLDDSMRAKGLNCVGILAWSQGDMPAARSVFEESLDIRLRTGDMTGAAAVLNNLGLVAGSDDDPGAARTYLDRAAQIYRELGDKQRLGMVLTNLGINFLDMGEYGPARDASLEYLEISEGSADPWHTAVAWQNLADIAQATRDLEEAIRLARLALQSMMELGDLASVLQLLILSGRIVLDAGLAEDGVRLLAASEALQDAKCLSLRRRDTEARDRSKKKAADTLPADRFAACWADGLRMSIEDATQLAISVQAGKC